MICPNACYAVNPNNAVSCYKCGYRFIPYTLDELKEVKRIMKILLREWNCHGGVEESMCEDSILNFIDKKLEET